MSAFGTKPTFRGSLPRSAFGGKADMRRTPTRFTGSLVNKVPAVTATGPLFHVSHLETPPPRLSAGAGLKAAGARLSGCVFQTIVEAIALDWRRQSQSDSKMNFLTKRNVLNYANAHDLEKRQCQAKTTKSQKTAVKAALTKRL